MRWLVVFHRWIGVALCLFFAMWFATGAVMLYVPYPFLSDGKRIAGSEALAGGQVKVGPAEAVAVSGIPSPARVRLLETAGQATYVVNPGRGRQILVSAETGQVLGGVSPEQARTIAQQFAKTPVRAISEPMDYDQWMVHHRFDRYRPLYRVSLSDEAQTELYVSQRSGEVVQRTTRFERAWNYVGAVAHWIYPTVLRQSWVVWDRTVWWLSLVGVSATMAGIWLGITRWRRYAALTPGGISPFRGWMKWHHVVGLVSATFVFTWILSGWLSMDHGRIFSTGEMTDEQADAYSGMSVADAARAVTPGTIQGLLPAAEIEVMALDGKPYLIARGGGQGPKVSAVVDGTAPAPAAAFPDDAVWKAVQAAYPNRTVEKPIPIPANDVYANLRSSDGVGGDGLRVSVKDGVNTAVYVNQVTGKVIEVMDTSRRAYRWLYFGLHTLDFPFLSNDAVWKSLMLVLLAVGFAFSLTGITLGWRRLRRLVRKLKPYSP